MSKVVIVGGGASSMVASILLSQRNDVIILEKNNDLGKKLLITGSGRCNYYNDDMNISHFHSDSNDLERLIKDRKKVLTFFNELGIIPKVINGYYYPISNTSYSIFNTLKNEINKRNIKVVTNYEVKEIKKDNNSFIINNDIKCDKLILATGGKTYPKTGSTGDGYKFLKDFNLKLIDLSPSLISLESDIKYAKKWSGIRSNAKLSLYENDKLVKEEIGEILLTDYGISGICTFNLSRYVSKGIKENKEEIIINFVDFLNIKNKGEFINYLDKRYKELNLNKTYELFEGFMNYKLVNILLGSYKDKNWNKLKRNEKDEIATLFYELKINITNVRSFEKAQITSGGLSLDEIDLNTMEVKKVKDLYVIGELLDVDGDCGGYNLTFAFLTALKVGESIG